MIIFHLGMNIHYSGINCFEVKGNCQPCYSGEKVNNVKEGIMNYSSPGF
jgi:hypothetical protein